MRIPFTKMHGLGNDYLYVDCFAQRLEGIDLPELSRRISDRHRGVGGDGLILIAPPTAGTPADVRMEMYNADGSRGEMCGNGIRCVAKYAIERRLHGGGAGGALASGARPAAAIPLRIQSDRGVHPVEAFAREGAVREVRVGMGAPILAPARIPVSLPGDRCIRRPLPLPDHAGPAGLVPPGGALSMTCVSMGNPHAVIFLDSAGQFDALDSLALHRIGPIIERHTLFPARTNVHFALVRNRREAAIKTWERGAGATMACGTGACAVLTAGVLEDRLDRDAQLHLPGGALRIEWPDGGEVFMTGPAVEVFSGTWTIA